MQPPPKGGGKPVGEGEGNTVGMQPSRERVCEKILRPDFGKK
jgi:hypothetical protein